MFHEELAQLHCEAVPDIVVRTYLPLYAQEFVSVSHPYQWKLFEREAPRQPVADFPHPAEFELCGAIRDNMWCVTWLAVWLAFLFPVVSSNVPIPVDLGLEHLKASVAMRPTWRLIYKHIESYISLFFKKLVININILKAFRALDGVINYLVKMSKNEWLILLKNVL